MTTRRVPLWLKLGWTVWVAVWVPTYWRHYGPQNFLWFCDLANLFIAVALWLESPLLFSTQALSVLLVQTLFAIDLVGRLLGGRHLLGGTEYMFDPSNPLCIRLLSLFHVVTPPLLVWALARLGYDRRALVAQTVIAWIVLGVCFFGTGPDRDLNWVFGPYERPQHLVSRGLYFALCLVGYPLLLYLPTHLALRKWAPRAGSPVLGVERTARR
jgi:hypothetical protein